VSTDRPRYRYKFGHPVPLCETCGADVYPERECPRCQFPRFTMLGGMRMLARGLLLHQGYDPDAYPDLVAELEDTIGEELLDIGRETLAEHHMAILGPLEVSDA
jgi:hypothetical protein